MRADLLERYQALPLPTTKDEHWRFTDLRGFDPDAWRAAPPTAEAPASLLDLDVAAAATIDESGIRVSDFGRTPDGVRFEALRDDHALLGSLVQPDDKLRAHNAAVWEHGQYRLVVKRPLAGSGERRPTFQPAVFTPVAVQAWDGGAGETGTRMSLTSWYYLRLEEPQSNRRFVVPPAVALLTFVAMVGVIRAANRRR